jgi:hypothetical protein
MCLTADRSRGLDRAFVGACCSTCQRSSAWQQCLGARRPPRAAEGTPTRPARDQFWRWAASTATSRPRARSPARRVAARAATGRCTPAAIMHLQQRCACFPLRPFLHRQPLQPLAMPFAWHLHSPRMHGLHSVHVLGLKTTEGAAEEMTAVAVSLCRGPRRRRQRQRTRPGRPTAAAACAWMSFERLHAV